MFRAFEWIISQRTLTRQAKNA